MCRGLTQDSNQQRQYARWVAYSFCVVTLPILLNPARMHAWRHVTSVTYSLLRSRSLSVVFVINFLCLKHSQIILLLYHKWIKCNPEQNLKENVTAFFVSIIITNCHFWMLQSKNLKLILVLFISDALNSTSIFHALQA